ncbi:checkpoint protein Hus1/Mec3 [Hyaloraphidium curvatum]|nr:checkpoint protein Hus1/Mec3 [Hyaloraphidium curvatum]
MVQSVDKLCKRCILKLTNEHAHFIVANLSGDSNVQVWGNIEMKTMFEDLRIESLNNNEIWLELSPDALSRALKSTQSAVEAVCKLTKKDNLPSLSFQIITSSRPSGGRVATTQDVPVRVLTSQQAEEYREPMVPEPQVHIYTPSLGSFRNVVDRLKALSSHVSVAGNMKGQLRLQVESDILQVETAYSDLNNPKLDATQIDVSQQASYNRDPDEFAKVTVDCRDLSKFVGSHIVNPTSVVCCIIENHALVFYVYIGSDQMGEENYGSLTYYIPTKSI